MKTDKLPIDVARKIIEEFQQQQKQRKQKQWEEESLKEYEASRAGHRNNDLQ